MTESVQDGVLKAIEIGQRLTVEALSAATCTFDGMVPDRGQLDADGSWAESLLTPKDAIETSFRFTERMLESQKAFLAELVAVSTPSAPSSGRARRPRPPDDSVDRSPARPAGDRTLRRSPDDRAADHPAEGYVHRFRLSD